MKCAKNLFISILFLSVLPALFSQDALQQKSQINSLSQQIKEQLEKLRVQSNQLTQSLQVAQNELNLSQKEVSKLKMELTDLNSCLTATNEKVEELSTNLLKKEIDLKHTSKIMWTLIIICILFIVAKIVVMIIKIKYNITLPYWLNCLI